MLDLVGAGVVAPSASQVAEAAGVGLRTVFRHFADMDALYREMTEAIEARVLPILLRPPLGETWQARLADLAERRAQIFETIMPYRISASLRRFESPYLMQDYRRMLRLEAQTLEAYLPETVKADATAVQGLGVILSFATWRLLRRDQGLGVEQARAVVRRMLADALAALPQD
ncbi:MAG: TetR family transcriptional regulator [Porphyrobacter sp.]|nr:TetR family transcriptional regulator [Porphyrobacter sp.]